MEAGSVSRAKLDPKLIQELGKLVPPKDGGSSLSSVQFSKQFQDRILSLLEASTTPSKYDTEHFEKVYKKLDNDPKARSRLENLHAARAHKYGYAHFGPKSLFRESTNVAKKLKSQAERRKFRAGLKGLVDFLNQLNIRDLERLLQNGDTQGFNTLKMPMPVLPETVLGSLEHAPPLKIMQCINKQKATDIQNLLGRISSMAHFSQSMTDYFAHDDALEPALAVVCEVLRNNAEVSETIGKNTTFLSLAQPYEKHRSEADHDVVGRDRSKPSAYAGRSRRRRGVCLYFQNGTCVRKVCPFEHNCEQCGSSRHGKNRCSQKRSRDRRSRKSKSKN